MDIQEITQAIEDFKQIRTRNSITPESLGALLEDIVGAVSDELTATIENITQQGESTIENIQQQLQETLQSVTEQMNAAVASMQEQEATHRSEINNELVIFRNNVQILVSNVQDQMEQTQNNVQTMIASIRDEMQGIYDQVSMTTLVVTVATSKTEFTNKDEWAKVWNAMQNNTQLPFCIAVVFASGSKNFYYPTCVKNNYIILDAKAGSCELHVNEDGTFSITGTNLW